VRDYRDLGEENFSAKVNCLLEGEVYDPKCAEFVDSFAVGTKLVG